MNFHIFDSDEAQALLDMPIKLSEFMKEITMNMTELKTALDAVHAELMADNAAITDELAKLNISVENLTAEVAAAGGTTPEVDAALADVQASADALAALVPAPAA